MALRISPGSVSKEGASESIGCETGSALGSKLLAIVAVCCALGLLLRMLVRDAGSSMTVGKRLTAAEMSAALVLLVEA
jgi:hypothetical protein